MADLIVSAGDESFLESHRREITVVFCDLRGFTAFAETSEPEEIDELSCANTMRRWGTRCSASRARSSVSQAMG